MIDFELLRGEVARHPYPLLFATISGAHLYGFPSPDTGGSGRSSCWSAGRPRRSPSKICSKAVPWLLADGCSCWFTGMAWSYGAALRRSCASAIPMTRLTRMTWPPRSAKHDRAVHRRWAI